MKAVCLLLLASMATLAVQAEPNAEEDVVLLENIREMLEGLEDLPEDSLKSNKEEEVTVVNGIAIKKDKETVKQLVNKLTEAIGCAKFTPEEEDELDDILSAVFPQYKQEDDDDDVAADANNEEQVKMAKRGPCHVNCKRGSCSCDGPECRCKCTWFKRAKCWKPYLPNLIKDIIKPTTTQAPRRINIWNSGRRWWGKR